jgi:CRP/FNR family cyclic AMP-dependent transcriptional regulator
MDSIEILRSSELFSELEEEQILAISGLIKKRTAPKNTLIIQEGDTSDSLFIIKEGKVNVTLSNDQGKEIILSTLTKGAHFGELSLLDDDPRSSNVIAVEKCEFLILHKHDFISLMKQHPSIAFGIIKYLCRQVRSITQTAERLALMDVYQRLVNLLTDMARPNEAGKLVIETPLTHKEIAMRVGSSREMISRIMSELEKGQYLSSENKKITVHKKLPLAW